MLSSTWANIRNLIPPIFWVLIDQHLIFCPPTWPTCCNLPRKCASVKYKAKSWASNCHMQNLYRRKHAAAIFFNFKAFLQNNFLQTSIQDNFKIILPYTYQPKIYFFTIKVQWFTVFTYWPKISFFAIQIQWFFSFKPTFFLGICWV